MKIVNRVVHKSKTARTSSRASDGSIVSNDDRAYGTQQRTVLQDCKEGLELDHVIWETLAVCLTIAVPPASTEPGLLRDTVAVLIAAGGGAGAASRPLNSRGAIGRGRTTATPLTRTQETKTSDTGGEADTQEQEKSVLNKENVVYCIMLYSYIESLFVIYYLYPFHFSHPDFCELTLDWSHTN